MWTNHELEKLKQLHAMGMSTYEIAQSLGRTRSSIEDRCHRLIRAGALAPITRMQKIKICQRARARSDAERYRQNVSLCAP
jgi:hypothetical protein